jgi:carboxypeptidase PM20D1
MRKRILFALVFLILAITGFLAVNTIRLSTNKSGDLGRRKAPSKDISAARRLQEAVSFASVSYEDSSAAALPQTDSLIAFLRRTYPRVFASLESETINNHSLLLKWPGKDPVRLPVLLYAHMDVVPVENGPGSSWRFDPFGTTTDPDTVYGRGCIDDKAGVIGILEGIDRLLNKSFTPARTVYIAFGHDEETGGREGAARVAQTLRERGTRLEWVLDEGGMVAVNIVPFVEPPVALVMTAEKGYMSVEISTSGKGGHSSFPPPESPVDVLNAALQRIHEHPFEKRIISSLEGFMEKTGPEMRFPFNVLFLNRWLFGPIIMGEYEKIPEGNAMIRTTTACTVVQAGVKDNVIPSSARAVINLRLLPGDKSDDVFGSLKDIIHDERVSLRVLGRKDEASPVSSTGSEGYKQIESCIRSVFPDAVVAPTISIAATDSRYFHDISTDIYRFLPVRMDRSILAGMHGANERIGVVDFMETVSFYEHLLGMQ